MQSSLTIAELASLHCASTPKLPLAVLRPESNACPAGMQLRLSYSSAMRLHCGSRPLGQACRRRYLTSGRVAGLIAAGSGIRSLESGPVAPPLCWVWMDRAGLHAAVPVLQRAWSLVHSAPPSLCMSTLDGRFAPCRGLRGVSGLCAEPHSKAYSEARPVMCSATSAASAASVAPATSAPPVSDSSGLVRPL